MDRMDIDHIVEVPDTPDRLTARRYIQRSGDKNRWRNTIHSERQRSVEEATQIRLINTESGKKRLVSRPPKSTSNSLHPKNMPIDLTDSPNQRHEAGKRNGLADGSSSPHGTKSISTPVGNSSIRTDNTIRVGSVIENGNREVTRILGNGQIKHGNNVIVPVDSSASPRINRQKRLVHNGCISPNNIVKAKESSGKEINGPVAVVQNNNTSLGSSASPICPDIMDLVADDDNSYKGKGKVVVCEPCSSKETDSRNKYWPGRSSSITDKPKETKYYYEGVATRIERTDGWISTRNLKANISLSSEDQVVSEMSDPKYAHQPLHTRTGRRENGISISNINNLTQNANLHSSDHSVVGQPLGQSRSNPRFPTHVRKLRLESDLSRFAECSTPAHDDPEIVVLSSPGEPSTSRTASRRVKNLQPVIQVEDFSPELRYNRNVEDVRAKQLEAARQLEADERLAHELQQQFYNETPTFGAEEFDQHIAMALQQQDDGSASPPHRSSRPVYNARGPRVSNANRESQLQSSNVPRRGSRIQAQAAALGRMTRHRNQFPGAGRTILPSAGGTSLFPPNMDIETRMHYLGAMEAMETGLSLLQTQRDFNENDYEMLLALDENNNQRGGASSRVINGLPLSTVQSTTYDETCAVCLETPTIGDTIRHLPCLHKFHKDCIDPWLTRKTSCPVCKSSVTVT